ASTFTRTGGVYVYLTEQYGSWLGFLWGWAMFWSMHSGIIAAIAVVFARYVAGIAPGAIAEHSIPFLAVAAIAVLSAVNYVGVRPGSIVQTGLTVAKVVAIALLLMVLFGSGVR